MEFYELKITILYFDVFLILIRRDMLFLSVLVTLCTMKYGSIDSSNSDSFFHSLLFVLCTSNHKEAKIEWEREEKGKKRRKKK